MSGIATGALGTAAIIGGALSAIGGIFGASSAKRRRRAAAREKRALNAKITNLENSRQAIINPYAGAKDLSSLASDLSGSMSNPFASLGVATQAAEMQIEEADIALANTLDTLRATGASAGGATALAQAALKSKKGVSASIEVQEAQNEKLRAEGRQQLQQQKIAEQRRLQGIQIGEGQRMQQADASGKQFMFGAQETRETGKLDRLSAQLGGAQARESQAASDQTAAITGAIGGLTSIAGSYMSGLASTAGPAGTGSGGGGADTSQVWNGSKASSSTCFVVGTKVLVLNNELKNIEDFKINDRVVTGSGIIGIVKKQITHEINDVIPIYVKGEIETTDKHPLFVNNTWTNAKKLNWDYEFRFIDKLYNLEIDAQDPTYIVNNVIASGKIDFLVNDKKIKQI